MNNIQTLLHQIHDEADHIMHTEADCKREVALQDSKEIKQLVAKALKELGDDVLDQEELVTICELALVALDDESILEQLDISDEYVAEFKTKLAKIQSEKISS